MTVLACNVVFPANLSEGMLFQTWGSPQVSGRSAKAWMGIRKCSAADPACNFTQFFYLRVRAGRGDESISPQVDVDDSTAKDSGPISWAAGVDRHYQLSRDDASHQVLWCRWHLTPCD